MRALRAFLIIILLTFVASAQHTGGSFGGSRWGSGAPSRPSTPTYRPAPTYARPAYRPSPTTYRPTVYARPAPRPVVVHTSTTHVVPVGVPVSTGHWSGHEYHEEQPVVIETDDRPRSNGPLLIFAVIVIFAIVLVGLGVSATHRR